MCVVGWKGANFSIDKPLENIFPSIQKVIILLLSLQIINFVFDVGLFCILNPIMTNPKKLPAVSQAATRRRCLSKNAVIKAISRHALGILKHRLIHLYIFFVGNGDGGVALSEFWQHDII